MKIGILGTGIVGNTLGTKLVQLGHEVLMGARSTTNEKALEWVNSAGVGATQGTFADAARFGEFVLNCTGGQYSVDAFTAAGADALRGKILIDVSNPLDFSQGMPPTLTVCNTDSVGEQLQHLLPDTLVVKALNTINCDVMVNPALVPGAHSLFIAGENAEAKTRVTDLLVNELGWPRASIVDLGGIISSRNMEMFVTLWINLMVNLGHPNFSFELRVGSAG